MLCYQMYVHSWVLVQREQLIQYSKCWFCCHLDQLLFYNGCFWLDILLFLLDWLSGTVQFVLMCVCLLLIWGMIFQFVCMFVRACVWVILTLYILWLVVSLSYVCAYTCVYARVPVVCDFSTKFTAHLNVCCVLRIMLLLYEGSCKCLTGSILGSATNNLIFFLFIFRADSFAFVLRAFTCRSG